MELVKVIAKTSFVSQSVGSVNKKQELHISKALAEHLASLDLVDYPKKSLTPDSATDAGVGVQSASLPAETASPTLTLDKPKSGRGRPAGKR